MYQHREPQISGDTMDIYQRQQQQQQQPQMQQRVSFAPPSHQNMNLSHNLDLRQHTPQSK